MNFSILTQIPWWRTTHQITNSKLLPIKSLNFCWILWSPCILRFVGRTDILKKYPIFNRSRITLPRSGFHIKNAEVHHFLKSIVLALERGVWIAIPPSIHTICAFLEVSSFNYKAIQVYKNHVLIFFLNRKKKLVKNKISLLNFQIKRASKMFTHWIPGAPTHAKNKIRTATNTNLKRVFWISRKRETIIPNYSSYHEWLNFLYLPASKKCYLLSHTNPKLRKIY